MAAAKATELDASDAPSDAVVIISSQRPGHRGAEEAAEQRRGWRLRLR